MSIKSRTTQQFPRWLACVGLVFLSACSALPSASAKGNTDMNTSAKIESLFAHTKEICFGRYVLTVPAEAQVAYGRNRIDGQPPIIHRNQAKNIKQIMEQEIQDYKKGKASWQSPIFHRMGAGPLPNSLSMLWSEDQIRLESGDYYLDLWVVKGNDVFEYSGYYVDRYAKTMTDGNRKEVDQQNIPRNEQEAWDKLLPLVRATRPRADDEVPTESGFCVPGGFVSDATYKYREQAEMGIRLPSLPDISFSISSVNYGSLEGVNGAGALEMAQSEMRSHGENYGYQILRKGRAPLQTWRKGEEVLGKQKTTGHLSFVWMSVGEDGSVANPNEIKVQMFSKVEADTVGLAKDTSLTDDEGIALWDKLLKGFRFRVPIKVVN